jgi:hypothetical protein
MTNGLVKKGKFSKVVSTDIPRKMFLGLGKDGEILQRPIFAEY